MSARRSCRGFSLLEVLVAFTILAMLLGALFQVFSGGLHAARAGDRYTRATVIAQSTLAALGAEQPIQEGVTSGSADGMIEGPSSHSSPLGPLTHPLVRCPRISQTGHTSRRASRFRSVKWSTPFHTLQI